MTNNLFSLSPGVLWITGLSGSGKTTISKILFSKLKKKYNNIILLDGDILRTKLKILSHGTFSYNSRKKIGLKYGALCKKYLNKGYFIIIAVMALHKGVHKWNKKNLKNYYDVFLQVPMKELMKRDPKKIYYRYKKRQIKNVAGLDLDYDIPKNPTLKIIWKSGASPKKISKRIIKTIF
jgi:adenylylsulfate kinase